MSIKQLAVKIPLLANELATVQQNLTHEQLVNFSECSEGLPVNELPSFINLYMPNAFERVFKVIKFLFTKQQIAKIINNSEFYGIEWQEAASKNIPLHELLALEWLMFTLIEGATFSKPLNASEVCYFIANHWSNLLSPKEYKLLTNISNIKG